MSVSQHAKILHYYHGFIEFHNETRGAGCQGEWVIVSLLSIRLQTFTNC